MSKIIIVDSCAELNEEMKKEANVKKVNFHIDIDEKHLLADENLDTSELIEMMNDSSDVVRTAAPSPDAYYEAAQGYDEIYFVSISSKLSASYNSAVIAKSMIEDENPGVKVHAFDTKSAACGESQVISYIQKLMNEGKSFDEIVAKTEAKIDGMQTIFVLENLDNLIKNGRMSRVAGFVANALSIYPICYGVDGEIEVKHKARGLKKAMNKLIETIGELGENLENKFLYITHIHNYERALSIKEKAQELYNFKAVEIFEGSALSTIYANESGIILSFWYEVKE